MSRKNSAMTRILKRFIAKVKEHFPNVDSEHCFVHLQVLMVKTVPAELKSVFDVLVNMVNFVNSKGS